MIIMNKIILLILLAFLIFITRIYFEEKIQIKKVKSILLSMLLTIILLFSSYILKRNYGINIVTINYLFLIYLLFIVTIHDIKYQIIPLECIYFGIAIGLIFIALNPNLEIIGAIISSTIYLASLYSLSKILKEGIGLGDVFIFTLINFITNWKTTFSILLLSLILAGSLGIILFILKKANRKTSLPFMPFIFISSFIILLL